MSDPPAELAAASELAAAFQIRLMQRLDADPLFTPAVFTYSVEEPDDGLEVQVQVAPLFVHLASREVRARLAEVAEHAVRLATDARHRGALLQIGSAGSVRGGDTLLGSIDSQHPPD